MSEEANELLRQLVHDTDLEVSEIYDFLSVLMEHDSGTMVELFHELGQQL